jgi:hypothetical protein
MVRHILQLEELGVFTQWVSILEVFHTIKFLCQIDHYMLSLIMSMLTKTVTAILQEAFVMELGQITNIWNYPGWNLSTRNVRTVKCKLILHIFINEILIWIIKFQRFIYELYRYSCWQS